MDTQFRDSPSGHKVDQFNHLSLADNEAVSFYFGLYHVGLSGPREQRAGILPDRSGVWGIRLWKQGGVSPLLDHHGIKTPW